MLKIWFARHDTSEAFKDMGECEVLIGGNEGRFLASGLDHKMSASLRT